MARRRKVDLVVVTCYNQQEVMERVQVLLSTADDSGQIFEDIAILPYSVQKNIINFLKD